MRFFFIFFSFIDRTFARVIDVLTVILLLAMGGLTLGQVILRDFFNGGIPGAEVAARHMVLWIAFLGGMLATRRRQHVSIDLVTRSLSPRPRNAVRILLDGLAATVASMLARAAWAFVLDEREMGEMLFWGLPGWWVMLIIPFGFAMIAFEYAVSIAFDVSRIVEVGSEGHEAGTGRKADGP